MIEACGRTVLSMDSYVRAEKSHKLLCRPDQTSIDYTDGDQLERKLYEALRDTNDCSTFSPELPPLIVDWPSEYHLSRTRHCLLRPLEIKPGDKVLELGCGCGAITRYLGELGSDVTAVEGSMETRASLMSAVVISTTLELSLMTLRTSSPMRCSTGCCSLAYSNYASVFSPRPTPPNTMSQRRNVF